MLDGNNITGTADPICGETAFNLTFFSADCDRPDPEVECSCCNVCCNDNNATCNNFDWRVNLDGIWEYDFQRLVYSFSQEALPADAKENYTNYKHDWTQAEISNPADQKDNSASANPSDAKSNSTNASDSD